MNSEKKEVKGEGEGEEQQQEEMIAELTYLSSPKIIVLDDDESPSTSDSQCFDEWRKESSHSEKEKRSEAEDEIV